MRLRRLAHTPQSFTSLGLLLFLLTIALILATPATANPSDQTAHLGLDQIVDRLEAKNAARAEALQQFEATRLYHMQYRGFPSSYTAEMVVQMTYRAPGDKDFRVLSQSGSKLIIDRVFKKLLEAEKEAASSPESRRQVALTRENYAFSFAGYEALPGGGQYVLNLDPKKKNKFLYRGKIWVDATDFAVLRIQAQPAVNPSFWIKKTVVNHVYEKTGDFYLPRENRTESTIRLGGTANMTIEYKDYKIIKAGPPPASAAIPLK